MVGKCSSPSPCKTNVRHTPVHGDTITVRCKAAIRGQNNTFLVTDGRFWEWAGEKAYALTQEEEEAMAPIPRRSPRLAILHHGVKSQFEVVRDINIRVNRELGADLLAKRRERFGRLIHELEDSMSYAVPKIY